MQQLILDGYNVIHKIPQLARHVAGSLEDGRRALIRFMDTWRKTHQYRGKISIVFDGKDEIHAQQKNVTHGIQCLYTTTRQDADDRIISMVRRSRNTAGVTVISDDNYITNNCRIHGAAVKPAQVLLQPSRPENSGSDKEIDGETAQEINRFLKDKWGV